MCGAWRLRWPTSSLVSQCMGSFSIFYCCGCCHVPPRIPCGLRGFSPPTLRSPVDRNNSLGSALLSSYLTQGHVPPPRAVCLQPQVETKVEMPGPLTPPKLQSSSWVQLRPLSRMAAPPLPVHPSSRCFPSTGAHLQSTTFLHAVCLGHSENLEQRLTYYGLSINTVFCLI